MSSVLCQYFCLLDYSYRDFPMLQGIYINHPGIFLFSVGSYNTGIPVLKEGIL